MFSLSDVFCIVDQTMPTGSASKRRRISMSHHERMANETQMEVRALTMQEKVDFLVANQWRIVDGRSGQAESDASTIAPSSNGSSIDSDYEEGDTDRGECDIRGRRYADGTPHGRKRHLMDQDIGRRVRPRTEEPPPDQPIHVSDTELARITSFLSELDENGELTEEQLLREATRIARMRATLNARGEGAASIPSSPTDTLPVYSSLSELSKRIFAPQYHRKEGRG